MGLLPLPEPEELTGFSLGFMMLVYGYILLQSSKMISSGSELLMLVLNPGIVGGLVLPILGAVPDGAIILVSGMGGGSKEDIQKELAVGVGTLAGSTIMLLTLPWAASIFLGRCDILPNGRANYKNPKLTRGADLQHTGVTVEDDTPFNAKIMAATAITYLIIQGPALFASGLPYEAKVSAEQHWALAGLVLAAFFLAAYCVYQVKNVQWQEKKIEAARSRAVQSHVVSRLFFVGGSDLESPLLPLGTKSPSSITDVELTQAFRHFDKDNDGSITREELSSVLDTMGGGVTASDLASLMAEMDRDNSQTVSLSEFKLAVRNWLKSHQQLRLSSQPSLRTLNEQEDDDEDEEHEDMTPAQIKLKSFLLLFCGAVVVSIFSDPMVDVINESASRLSISPFYVSFLVTPIASNASEVIASLILSAKKKQKTISLTLSALYGAATMNNTFCLCIFLCLVFFRQLAWTFAAEVLAILFVELCLCIIAMGGTTIRLWKAILVALLFPFSLLLVLFLENVCGLD